MKQEKNKASKQKNKNKFDLKLLLMAVLFGVFCFLAGRYYFSYLSSKENFQTQLSELKENLSDQSELISAEYLYTGVGEFSSAKDVYGFKIPFSTKKFIISFDGAIKAGIDLKEVEFSLKGNTITVSLPKAKVLSNTIDEGSIKVFDERDGLFNPITITDYVSFAKDQKAAMEQKAVSGGLLERGTQNAKVLLEGMLRGAFGQSYEIVFEVE